MTKNIQLMVSILILVMPAACVYIPAPDIGHLSGRAVITSSDIEYLKAEEGDITRKHVLMMLGEPSKRYNRDEYFCYSWERIQGVWFTGGNYGAVSGGVIGRSHWLCMQFDVDSKLTRVEHIESSKEKRDAVLSEWNKSGLSDGLKVTYDYYNLDKIKYEVIHAMAVKGFPESQWRLYDEFGKKPDDRSWLCRSADSGYAKAQLEVGRIYWDSTGIPKHKIKAYVWYRLATSGDRLQGNPADRETLVQANDAIKEAVNALDQDQLVEAYDRYSEWETGQCELELANSGLE